MKTQHTPGPWSFSQPLRREFYGAGEWYECLVHVGDKAIKGNALAIVNLGGAGATSTRKEEVLANARLIAAAPDMAEVCRQIVLESENGNWPNGMEDILEGARAAIAKATSKSTE